MNSCVFVGFSRVYFIRPKRLGNSWGDIPDKEYVSPSLLLSSALLVCSSLQFGKSRESSVPPFTPFAQLGNGHLRTQSLVDFINRFLLVGRNTLENHWVRGKAMLYRLGDGPQSEVFREQSLNRMAVP